MTIPTPPSAPEGSILEGVKKSLGIAPDEDHFDSDLIMHTNAALSVLQQHGVGPAQGLMIEDNSTVWAAVTSDPTVLGMAKQAVFFRVKLGFDPPPTSFTITSTENLLKELEWRLIAEVERKATA